VRSLGGAMLARMAPQSAEERAAITQAGLDMKQVFTVEDLVTSDDIFFAATGITGTPLLPGIVYKGSHAETHSLLIRAKTKTRRFIQTEFSLDE
jgi:fructose-1,6-bisphosphatase II